MEAKRTRVRREMVEAVHSRLQSLPAYEPDEMTMTEAVRRLLPDIHALQKRGYGLDAVAALLTEEGMAISGAGLKALMRHALDAKKRRKARRPAGPGEEGRHKETRKVAAPEPPRAIPSTADVGSASGTGGREENVAPSLALPPGAASSNGARVPEAGPRPDNESGGVGGSKEEASASALPADASHGDAEAPSPVTERSPSGGTESALVAAPSPASPCCGKPGGRENETRAGEVRRDSGAAEAGAADATGSVRKIGTSDPVPEAGAALRVGDSQGRG